MIVSAVMEQSASKVVLLMGIHAGVEETVDDGSFGVIHAHIIHQMDGHNMQQSTTVGVHLAQDGRINAFTKDPNEGKGKVGMNGHNMQQSPLGARRKDQRINEGS